MFIFLKHTIILLMIMLYILNVDAKAEGAPTRLHVIVILLLTGITNLFADSVMSLVKGFHPMTRV